MPDKTDLSQIYRGFVGTDFPICTSASELSNYSEFKK